MSRILSGISLGLLCLTTLARADDVQRMVETDGNPCFGWRFPCNNYGDPWTLFHSDHRAWSFGGWVEAGVTTNSDGAFLNGPLAFPSTNELLMNQLWFFAERKANTGGYGWDWGVHLDYVFGTDGPDTQAFGDGGWDFGWNSGGVTIPEHTYGSAIPQLYLEVAYNDVTVKLGRFYTIIGYEAVQAPKNFFYSHAYTMNYAEPFTHTGALVEWAWNEETMFYGGYVAGWDTGWENPTDAHMFLGGISLARWENAVLTYALTAGDMGVGGNRGQGDLYMHSIVFEYQLTDAWEYVFQSDFAAATNSTNQGENVHAYGINQYLFYEINNCWELGFRFEWFNAEDGHVVNNYDDPGDYYALTAGLNYRPNPNLIIRPEIRADWFDATNPGATLPFADNTSDDQFSAAFDFIFTF
ncbi:MAG: porin [Pirellulales bacterium]|nr:porin [Pirellulales bacterium]